jgi:hypothetical protein
MIKNNNHLISIQSIETSQNLVGHYYNVNYNNLNVMFSHSYSIENCIFEFAVPISPCALVTI